ncbi:hypothetical protein CsSME_00045058 [Camellia sinensis var. sinensis]
MSAPLENLNEDLGLGWDIENFTDLNMGEESASHNAQPNISYNIPLNILFFNTEGVARPNFLQHYMHLHSSGRFHLVIITNTKKKGKRDLIHEQNHGLLQHQDHEPTSQRHGKSNGRNLVPME